MAWPYQQTQELLFECLGARMQGQFCDLVSDVVRLAIDKGIYLAQVNGHSVIVDYTQYLTGADRNDVPELVRQLLWKQLVRGLIVFGSNVDNGNFPNYRITGLGEQFLDGQKPQPYDQNNFIADFRATNPTADPVIIEYLGEAVKTFNFDCLKSSAVMLGAASEKAILLLIDIFKNKIIDARKKTAFETALTRSPMIASQYRELHNKLLLMVNANRFPPRTDYRDIIIRVIPGIFDLLRRLRNVGGHPELIGNITTDAMFLNLRAFSEYINGVYKLIDYFTANDADW